MKKFIKPLKVALLILNYILIYWLFSWIYLTLAWSDYSMEASKNYIFFIVLILIFQLIFIVKYWKKPKIYFLSLIVGILIPIFIFVYLNFSDSGAFEEPVNQMTENESYQSQEDFDKSLKASLTTYFRELRSDDQLEVSAELLREGPTATGLAYPKFYVWVTLVKDGQSIESGALRIAEISVKNFEVTNYLSSKEISLNLDQLNEIFPNEVVEKIKERLL